MRTKRVTFVAAGLTVAGFILLGGTLVAGAQNGSDRKKGPADLPAVGQREPKKPDAAGAEKLDGAEQQKLRAELNDLLKQRADLDWRIAQTRGKLGETGRSHQRFEFRNGDGPPQVFEFNGDGSGSLPPEARKQIEEAQKRLRDVFGNMPLDRKSVV